MQKKTIVLILFLFLAGPLLSHSGKPSYHVIIDTDGALDDMRALTMFLSGNDIRVLAITCSQGSLMPESVYSKVKALLSDFHHEGIPVGMGKETGQVLPEWASFVKDASWGESFFEDESGVPKNASFLLDKVSKNYKEKFTLIALGSLKTYADWLRNNQDAIDKIDRIIWYNNPEIEKGFNYRASPESFDYIKKTGINLVIVGDNTDHYTINDVYFNALEKKKSLYARQIIETHEQKKVASRIQQNMLKCWDDLVPLYLTAPVLFKSNVRDNIRYVHPDYSLPEDMLYELVGALLESSAASMNRVFVEFPVDTSLYKPAYNEVLEECIDIYGLVEWKAICMTNEIHGHTGIYSIIGAKMGIRAMVYFNVGVNNLEVISYAGNIPPLSCFNDGVQISTGATIGQGLISIADSIIQIPTAVYVFNGRKVKIALKEEITRQIEQDIEYGIQTFGLLTEQYWLFIEKKAIQYWNEFDRNEIFEINIIL